MNQEQLADHAKAQLLRRVGTLCEKQLQQLFAQLLDKADTVFFDLAQSAARKERQGFFDSMRIVRLQRQTIEAEFHHQVHLILGRMPEPGASVIALRNSDDLRLMDKEDLTENIAFDSMVKRALTKHENALHHLLSWYQYVYGSYEIQADWLPVHPQQLGTAVRRSLRDLTLSARVKGVIYQLFEREVLGQLGKTLQAASQLFVESEAISAAAAAIPVDLPPKLRQLSDNEQHQVIEYLTQLEARAAQAKVAPAHSAPQLIAGLSAIQQKAPQLEAPRVLDLRAVLVTQPVALPSTAVPASAEPQTKAVTANVLLQTNLQQKFLSQDIDWRKRQLQGIGEAVWEMADDLPVPCCVLTQNAAGAPLRSKLAAKITAVGRYIFVNRNGVKVLDMKRHEVALAVAEMRMALIDDCALFDRVLCDVIQNLRRMKAQEDAAQVS